jgi:hypothetical protein
MHLTCIIFPELDIVAIRALALHGRVERSNSREATDGGREDRFKLCTDLRRQMIDASRIANVRGIAVLRDVAPFRSDASQPLATCTRRASAVNEEAQFD